MKLSRIVIILAALACAAAVAVLAAQLQPATQTVYVPVHDIGAYQPVNPKIDLKKVELLKDDKSPYALTGKYLADQIKEFDGVVFFEQNVLEGEIIDRRKLGGNAVGSLSVVLGPEERVVAVTSSVVGTAGNIIRAGDVVAVVGGDGGTLADYAKVISVGVGAEAGRRAVGADSDNPESTDEQQQQQNASTMTLLLGVSSDEAQLIASDNQGVAFVFNPFCKVQADGSIKPIDKPGAADACPEQVGADAAEDTDADKTTPAADGAAGDTTDTAPGDTAATTEQ